MKQNPDTLKVFFHSVEQLIARMQEDPNYGTETKNLFTQAIPEADMSRDKLEEYFNDKIRMSQMLSIKLNGWCQGFLKEHLSKYTPNDLINADIIGPKFNPPLEVKILKKLYQLKQSERTIYNWVNKDRLITSSNSGTRKYYRIDFEHMLINKGIAFDKKSVQERINQATVDLNVLNGFS